LSREQPKPDLWDCLCPEGRVADWRKLGGQVVRDTVGVVAGRVVIGWWVDGYWNVYDKLKR